MAKKIGDPISLNNWNLGGISESRILGMRDESMYKMVGTNVHDDVGLLQNNRRLVKDSGATIDGFVKKIVSCSDGNAYLFSSTSGKIWKRTSAGAYSLASTTDSDVGDDNILGACEYDGFLYWATQNYLYRIQVSHTGDSWATYAEEVGHLNIDPVCGDSNYLGGDDYTVDLVTALREDQAVTFDASADEVAWTSHPFSDGDKVVFRTTGSLPSELTSGTVYYIINEDTNDFQVTETPICTATTVTFTHGSDIVNLASHGLEVGMAVKFATTDTLPAELTAGTTYYVESVPTTGTFTIAETEGGDAIDITDNGTGTHTVVGVEIDLTGLGSGTHTIEGNYIEFIPQLKTMIGFAINIDTEPSTSVTFTLHDSDDTQIATKTVAIASLETGVNEIYWDSTVTFEMGETYHLHVYQTGTGGIIATGVEGDATYMYLEIYGESNDDYHPMVVQNDVLFIGDNNYVHQYENTLTLNALDIPAEHVIKCLGKMDIDLLLGTEPASTIAQAMIFRWNTWSESWTIEDEIPENGIHAFIPVDNFVYVVAGDRGNVYFYNGQQLQLYRRIGGEFDRTDKIEVNPNATASLHGIPLIGVGNSSGNPIECGVYGMGTVNPQVFPRIFDLEYVLSEGLSDMEIGSITVYGDDILVSWYDGDSTYGVDTFDGDNLYSGTYIQTRVLYQDRNTRSVYRGARINYKEVLDNTAQTVTFTNATDIVNLTDHGLQDGEPVVFSTTDTLPDELTAGTTYYVRDVADDTFKIAETSGGTAIDITDDGTGTHKVALANIIRFYYRKDYDTSWTELDLIHNEDKHQFVVDSFGDTTFCIEFKLELRAWADEGVVIDQITLLPQGNV